MPVPQWTTGDAAGLLLRQARRYTASKESKNEEQRNTNNVETTHQQGPSTLGPATVNHCKLLTIKPVESTPPAPTTLAKQTFVKTMTYNSCPLLGLLKGRTFWQRSEVNHCTLSFSWRPNHLQEHDVWGSRETPPCTDSVFPINHDCSRRPEELRWVVVYEADSGRTYDSIHDANTN